MGSPPELHNPPHTTTTHTHTHTASPPVQCVENAPVSNLADLPQNLTSLASLTTFSTPLELLPTGNMRATYPVQN